MNSQSFYDGQKQKKQGSLFNQKQFLDITLTFDQFIMIQHALPKKYALLQYKSNNNNNTKRIVSTGSAVKFPQQDAQNISKLSGNYQNTQQMQGRSKRPRPKKIDRFLQNEAPQKSLKRLTSERTTSNLDDQMLQCYNILVQLKKHKSAYPFLKPVDPKLDGALNYLDIIKEPMDLSTVQTNLKNGQYQTAGQFHGDINKIWLNSYAYNQKSSLLYKLTIQIEKYYKNICNNQGINKKSKIQQKSKQKQKGTKKQYQKNSQSQFKGDDRQSNLQKGNQNEFVEESDEFME